MVPSINAAVNCTLEEFLDTQKHNNSNNNNNNNRSQWVVNAPKPPCVLGQVFYNIKDTVFPKRNSKKRFDSLRKNQPLWKRVLYLLQQLFPIIGSLKAYNFRKLKFDVIAGLTSASLAIPQSIGFATLAQLSPEYGLYTCVVPPIIYSMLTSSREVVIGNVAMDSMLLASMIQKLKDPIHDSTAYTNLVLTATFFAGIFQVAFGLFRLGFVVDYLSHAAIVGFCAAAAIGIGLQQLRGLFGITQFTKNSDLVSVIKVLLKSFNSQSQWHPYSLIVGFSFLCLLVFIRLVGRRNKKLFWLSSVAPLLSIIVSTIIAYRVNYHQHNMNDYKLEVLGPIKGGSMNPISLYNLNFDHKFLGPLIKTGFTVAVISLTETIAVGRSFASMRGYNLNTNKEMLSMGIMNTFGSFTSCYVASGSLSRTALNYSAGSETAVSSIVMAITVLMTHKFLTRLLYFTPKSILAAIILSILPALIDHKKAKEIWKVDKFDFLALLGTFFGVLFSSVEMGLLMAVTISFAKIIVVSIQPGVAVVGMLPGTYVFGDVEQYPMALNIPGILILSLKSSWLCFANATLVRERIERWVNNEEEEEEKTDNGNGKSTFKFIILDASGLTNIDTAGIASLVDLNNSLTLHGIKLAIASPRWEVIDKLRLSDLVSKIGGRVFLSVGEAVDACLGAKLVTTAKPSNYNDFV